MTDLAEIKQDLEEIKSLLRQALQPASSLSVQEKAEAIKRALATGDKDVLKATMKRLNGE